MDWCRLYGEMLDDPKVGTLDDAQFRREFMAATRGEQLLMSAYVIPCVNRLSGNEWRALRKRVIERDGGICVYCGTRPEVPHIDHVTPLSKGDTNDFENLATACPNCNLSKSGKSLDEWINPRITRGFMGQ